MQEIIKISRSRVVDGVETEAGNFVGNTSFDGKPVELFENWCDVLLITYLLTVKLFVYLC